MLICPGPKAPSFEGQCEIVGLDMVVLTQVLAISRDGQLCHDALFDLECLLRLSITRQVDRLFLIYYHEVQDILTRVIRIAILHLRFLYLQGF